MAWVVAGLCHPNCLFVRYFDIFYPSSYFGNPAIRPNDLFGNGFCLRHPPCGLFLHRPAPHSLPFPHLYGCQHYLSFRIITLSGGFFVGGVKKEVACVKIRSALWFLNIFVFLLPIQNKLFIPGPFKNIYKNHFSLSHFYVFPLVVTIFRIWYNCLLYTSIMEVYHLLFLHHCGFRFCRIGKESGKDAGKMGRVTTEKLKF